MGITKYNLISTSIGLVFLYELELSKTKYLIEGLDKKFHNHPPLSISEKNDVFLLMTKMGYSITVSINQIVLVENKEIKIKDLKKGDLIKLSKIPFGLKKIKECFFNKLINFLKIKSDENIYETIDIETEENEIITFNISQLFIFTKDEIFKIFSTLFNTNIEYKDTIQILHFKSINFIRMFQLLLLGFGVKSQITGYSLNFCFNTEVCEDMVFCDKFDSIYFCGKKNIYSLIEPITGYYVANGFILK